MKKICFMWLGGLPADPSIKRLWIDFFKGAPRSSYTIITHTYMKNSDMNANWGDVDAIMTK